MFAVVSMLIPSQTDAFKPLPIEQTQTDVTTQVNGISKVALASLTVTLILWATLASKLSQNTKLINTPKSDCCTHSGTDECETILKNQKLNRQLLQAALVSSFVSYIAYKVS